MDTCEMTPIASSSMGEVPYYFSRSSVKFQGHKAEKSIWMWFAPDYKAGRIYQIPQICLIEW